mmetsp:Transcript_84116/g.223299  ORF Transcript_84116/g.223299 Transcript_84116/m.223299 type:complete len:104 (-) Transcript_84116:180-491(-)
MFRTTRIASLFAAAAALLASGATGFGMLDDGDEVALFQTSIVVSKAERVVGASGSCDANDPWGCDDEEEADIDDGHALYQTTVEVSPSEEGPKIYTAFDAFTL